MPGSEALVLFISARPKSRMIVSVKRVWSASLLRVVLCVSKSCNYSP